MPQSRLRAEQTKVIAEFEQRSAAENRSLAFVLQVVISNLALALAPAVPQAELVFGKMTVARGLTFVVASQLAFWAAFFIHRRLGAHHVVYRRFSAVEAASLYAMTLTFVWYSELTWSPVWVLGPFSAVFMGVLRPFRPSTYVAVYGGSPLVLGVLFLAGGKRTEAVVAVFIAVVNTAAYHFVSRTRRLGVLAQADLAVAKAELSEQTLESERELLTRSLTQQVAARLRAFSTELDRRLEGEGPPLRASAEQARVALAELEALAGPGGAHQLPNTVDELCALIDEKLRPLCVDVSYQLARSGELSTAVSPPVSLALLRIAQELVRNALTHGHAKTLDVAVACEGSVVSLTVRDDGKGLEPAPFESSTGGLENAKRWSSEQGGRVEFQRLDTGTQLRVFMPLPG